MGFQIIMLLFLAVDVKSYVDYGVAKGYLAKRNPWDVSIELSRKKDCPPEDVSSIFIILCHNAAGVVVSKNMIMTTKYYLIDAITIDVYKGCTHGREKLPFAVINSDKFYWSQHSDLGIMVITDGLKLDKDLMPIKLASVYPTEKPFAFYRNAYYCCEKTNRMESITKTNEINSTRYFYIPYIYTKDIPCGWWPVPVSGLPVMDKNDHLIGIMNKRVENQIEIISVTGFADYIHDIYLALCYLNNATCPIFEH